MTLKAETRQRVRQRHELKEASLIWASEHSKRLEPLDENGNTA
jgi:hypothetical protein